MSPLTVFLLSSVIFGALISLTQKRNTALEFLTAYFIISMVNFTSLVWVPMFFGWGAAVEIASYSIKGNKMTASLVSTLSLVFRMADAALANSH